MSPLQYLQEEKRKHSESKIFYSLHILSDLYIRQVTQPGRMAIEYAAAMLCMKSKTKYHTATKKSVIRMKEGSSRAHWFFVSISHCITSPIRFRHAVILYLLLSDNHQRLHFGRRNTYLNHLREWIVQIHLTKTKNTFQVHCPIYTLFSRVCIHIKIHHLYWSKFHVNEKSEWRLVTWRRCHCKE